jgi:hypothetical protein
MSAMIFEKGIPHPGYDVTRQGVAANLRYLANANPGPPKGRLPGEDPIMKTLRRSLLIVLLTVGAGACSTPIMGPDDAEQHNPGSGNHNPGSGNHNPGSGN